MPFLSYYKTFWTSLGIVAFWALLLLGVSYYARTRIGGPTRTRTALPHGGVVVYHDGSHEVIAPLPSVTVAQLAA